MLLNYDCTIRIDSSTKFSISPNLISETNAKRLLEFLGRIIFDVYENVYLLKNMYYKGTSFGFARNQHQDLVNFVVLDKKKLE